ncbi:MAG: pyrimidine operon attenuation protein/uracil phosphoribosyltransferase, partial [Bacteroidia bacterium]
MQIQRTIILTHEAVLQKINRMAWQILERSHNTEHIAVVGIEKKGQVVAQMLEKSLRTICDKTIETGSIKVNKDHPNLEDITLISEQSLTNKVVVLVDDVLNSGRTLMYATYPILAAHPKRLITAVLANRAHANFPIKGDIVGIELATTLQEHINFEQDK